MSRQLFSALLASAAIYAAAPAHAQDAPAAPAAPASNQADETLAPQGDVIVTATRRAESLQQVPMSVNVATGDALQKLNIFDVKDVQQLSPGLELTNSTGRNNTTTLRGITFDPDQGTSPAVQLYFNEIPTDAQTAYTAVYDIQQIEVLRGPQGLLRGLSAPAGALTITTRRPDFDNIGGYVQASGTTRAGYNVQGGITLPFSSVWSLRVAALVDGNRLNNVRNLSRGDMSRSRTESARATLGFRPSGDFSAYLTYQYLNADNTQYQQVVGPGNTPTYQLFPYFGGFLVPNTTLRSGPALGAGNYSAVAEGQFRIQNETHLVNLAMDWNLGPATLSFVGAHQSSLLNTLRDLDPGNAVPEYAQSSTVIVPYKVDTAELRLTTNETEGFGGAVGAFYTKQTGTTLVDQPADVFFFPTSISETQGALGEPPYLPITTRVVVPTDIDTWSFNANARFKSGGFNIEGGIRYSILRANNTTQLELSSPGSALGGVAPFSQPLTEIIPANLQRTTARPLTGGVTISYAFLPTLNAYAAYGHSFRDGSTGVAVPAGVSNDLIRTKPEKTDSFEVGLKGSFADHRFNFTIAGYYQKLNNFLSRFTGIYYNCPTLFGACFNSPPAAPINNPTESPDGSFDFNYGGNATIKGVEGSLDGRVGRNWDFGVSAAYAHARYDNALLPCNDFAGTGKPNATGTPRITGTGNVSLCRSNGRLAEVPDFSLTANTEIRMPLGSVTPFFRALFTYRPGFHSDRVNYDYQSRDLLNVFVGLRGGEGRWEVNVFARNLLDQHRITDISLGNATLPTSDGVGYDSGYRQVSAMNPREFGLTTSFKF